MTTLFKKLIRFNLIIALSLTINSVSFANNHEHEVFKPLDIPSIINKSSNNNRFEDLSLININNIGYENLNIIKNHEKIEWWVEMGDRLIVSFNDKDIKLPTFLQIITTQKDIDLSNLAFESSGHCNHESPHQDHNKDMPEKIHTKLDKIFSSGRFKLVSIESVINKSELFSHKQVLSFEKNKVLVYQYKNRKNIQTAADEQIEGLLAQVDKDRWFSQVEYLASLDRMLDADLVIAGNWLTAKFEDLGLTTSKIDLHGHRGFNVLGFKKGITKPDDWYVIGAHLDSRNQFWNDNQRSPGAEDNASGCSGVLEIANIISQYDTESSILFICFNGEERGLWGSGDVVLELTENGDIDKVKSMQNMDMISYRLGDRNAAFSGTNVAAYQDFANQLASNGELYTDLDWFVDMNDCCSDFESFTAAQIPAVTSIIPDPTGYFGYHRFNDLPENIDPTLAAGIVKANLATLAGLVGVDFDSNQDTPVITPYHTGLWYNLEQSGHGINVEILNDNRIVVFWYVYDDFGNQIWLLGNGEYIDSVATLDVIITDSGVFPPNYVTDNLNVIEWGTFEIEAIDCDSILFSWVPNDDNGFTAGSLEMTRITSIAGLECEATK